MQISNFLRLFLSTLHEFPLQFSLENHKIRYTKQPDFMVFFGLMGFYYRLRLFRCIYFDN